MLFKYNYCSGVTYHQKFDFLDVPTNLNAIFFIIGEDISSNNFQPVEEISLVNT